MIYLKSKIRYCFMIEASLIKRNDAGHLDHYYANASDLCHRGNKDALKCIHHSK